MTKNSKSLDEPLPVHHSELKQDKNYSTIFGVARYTGIKVRTQPILEDKSDRLVHVFEYLESGRYEVPEAHIESVPLVSTDEQQTKMMSPDAYLLHTILEE